MKRYDLEKLYELNGCADYRLHNLENLRSIHGVNAEQLQGYAELPPEQRELFMQTLIKFYNAQGLDRRGFLQPKRVNYVCEINYAKSTNSGCEIVGTEVYVIQSDGKTLGERLHRYKYDSKVNFKVCKEASRECYLRFELQDEWYHFKPNGEWY